MSVNIYDKSTDSLTKVGGLVDESRLQNVESGLSEVESSVISLSNEKANNGSQPYNPSHPYVSGETCTDGGKLWKCKINCSGVVPSEGTYWTEVTMSSIDRDLSNKFSFSQDKYYYGASYDFNSMENGIHYCSIQPQNVLNYPTTVDGILIQLGSADGYNVSQLYIDRTEGNTYSRGERNGVWGNWKTL